ncbi:Holliday junction branch migration protein RuvA [Neptunicella marina]|uniref:Holliday junction branch migration complex subunit RuvA n=1 Tax=Neptunicella marina TaxID=2125989 RepID=A0A8J6IRG3_9ALTE|nr:Holliday junction branch migration protein RuvA [Neptunicella marina]
MIGRIRGVVIEKQAPEVLVEAAGVGYEIQVPMTSFYQLPDAGQEAIIYTHFVVREDAQLLYGFANKTERALFRELIKANGVGPKLALTIMSGMSAEQFIQCVNYEDVTALVKLPGVGKKTAERLVVEMRDRLKNLQPVIAEGGAPMPANNESVVVLGAMDDAKQEALSALLALGYKQAQALQVIKSVYQDEMTSEQLIREALRAMA